ncbi:mechanosensitive ion channel family protein [Nanoarchaeota archaeon]
MILTTFYAIKGVQNVIDYGTQKVIRKRLDEEKDADTSIIDVLGKILKISIWFIAALLILSNLGYNISTLIAGLGIGGIAIAFALQNVLTDIFASFSIYFDKPFKVGDYIVVGADDGIVKKIGIKSTRITTLRGEELVISNKELTESRIHNYKKMKERRVVFSLGVTYDTKNKDLEKIPKMVESIFSKNKDAKLDRVHFKSFGEFSLNYEIVYFLKTRDYEKYMDVQQVLNLEIKKQFDKAKIDMAFPTQTVIVQK